MAKIGEAAPGTARALSRIDGVVIGVLMGFDDNGAPMVVFPGNLVERAVPARTTASLEHDHIGAEVALLFEQGDPARPLIMGRILHLEVTLNPAENRRYQAIIDDQRLELKAEREIVLRCGKASITLTRAGKILLRGTYLFSRSTGVNKIKGGSIQLN
jgi:hypothetical protein